MEIHAGEVSAQLAAQKAQMDHLTGVQKRIQAGITATFTASAATTSDSTVQQSLDRLEKRISDIERLLLLHDAALKDLNPTPKK